MEISDNLLTLRVMVEGTEETADLMKYIRELIHAEVAEAVITGARAFAAEVKDCEGWVFGQRMPGEVVGIATREMLRAVEEWADKQSEGAEA